MPRFGEWERMPVGRKDPQLGLPRGDRQAGRRALSRVAAAALAIGTGMISSAMLSASASVADAALGQGQTCTAATCTLTDTSVADTTWTVPAGISSATFTVDGAQGGRYSGGPRGGSGGNGAEVSGTVSALTPGSSYTLSVGGAGGDISSGGRNGGGSSGGTGGGGGGYSAVLK